MLKGLLENMGLGFLGDNIKKLKKIEVKNIFGSILRWHPIHYLTSHSFSFLLPLRLLISYLLTKLTLKNAR
jgi:hypothetical protein